MSLVPSLDSLANVAQPFIGRGDPAVGVDAVAVGAVTGVVVADGVAGDDSITGNAVVVAGMLDGAGVGGMVSVWTLSGSWTAATANSPSVGTMIVAAATSIHRCLCRARDGPSGGVACASRSGSGRGLPM